MMPARTYTEVVTTMSVLPIAVQTLLIAEGGTWEVEIYQDKEMRGLTSSGYLARASDGRNLALVSRDGSVAEWTRLVDDNSVEAIVRVRDRTVISK